RCHFQRLGQQAQNPPVIAHDILDKRDFEAESRLFLDGFHLPELQNKNLFAFIHDKDRGQDTRDNNRDSGQNHCRFIHQLLPPVAGLADGVSWFSGRYGTTPCPAPSPETPSRMTLFMPPKTSSIVSRYIRRRVTSGALTYSA